MDTNLFNDANEPIENKKKENASGGNNLNWKKFTLAFFGHFLVSICFFTVVIGACGLYTAKVAQSNILPTNDKFAPYTSTDYGMNTSDSDNSAKILINIVKGRSWKGFNFFDDATSINAQSATFIKENFEESGVFNFLCKMKPFTETNENFARIAFYLRKLFISGIASSFDMVNTLYSGLYGLPEWFLMLIYFVIFPFIFTFLVVWNAFKILLEAVSNLIKLPFRVNNPESGKSRIHNDINFTHVETDPKDPTSQWWRKWTQCEINKYSENHKRIWGTITEFMDYIGYGIMFMIYFTVTLYAFIPISLFATVFGLVNPLIRKYKLDNDSKIKTNGIGDFIRDTFVYKKTFIIFLAAYNLMMTTNIYLSKGYSFSCFIGLLILAFYFEVFSTPDNIHEIDATQISFKNNNDLTSNNNKPFEQVPKSEDTFCNNNDPYVTGVENKSIGKIMKVTNDLKDTMNSAYDGLKKKTKFNAKKLTDRFNYKKLDEVDSGPNVTPSQEPNINNPGPPVNTTQQENLPLIPKGGHSALKRNKSGALHKKYNFSLI